MIGLLHIFTIISYYFYSTAYISLKRNEIKKGKEQNTWCNRNQSFLQCSCVENGERRNYPQCNMISPTMHTRWHSVYVCVLCVWTVSIGGVFCNFGFGGVGGYSETEKSQSVKIYLNLNFPGGGYSATSDLDLVPRVGNLDFWGGYSETEKSQSVKICLNLNFLGGGGILKLYCRIGVFCRILDQIFNHSSRLMHHR